LEEEGIEYGWEGDEGGLGLAFFERQKKGLK
jgi:hypothetical protein